MKKIVVLAACMLFMVAGLAQADSITFGGAFSLIPSVVNGSDTTEGGGSVDVSSLNGQILNFLYCVDLSTVVYVPRTYSQTTVNTEGEINGSPVNNAGQIAWLLDNYGTGGQGDNAIALQAAIWTVEYGSVVYHLDTDHASDTVKNLYNNYLSSLGSNTGNVSNYLWITPSDGITHYQGQVGQVPEPSSLLFLGFGLVGLAGFGRKKIFKK